MKTKKWGRSTFLVVGLCLTLFLSTLLFFYLYYKKQFEWFEMKLALDTCLVERLDVAADDSFTDEAGYQQYKNEIEFLLTSNYDGENHVYSIDRIEFSSMEVQNLARYEDFYHFKTYYAIPENDEETSEFWGFEWYSEEADKEYFGLWKNSEEVTIIEMAPGTSGDVVIDEASRQLFIASGQEINIYSLEDYKKVATIVLPESKYAYFLDGYNGTTNEIYARSQEQSQIQSLFAENGANPVVIKSNGEIQEYPGMKFPDRYRSPRLRSELIMSSNFVFGDEYNCMLETLLIGSSTAREDYEKSVVRIKVIPERIRFHSLLTHDLFDIELPCEYGSHCSVVFAK